MARSLPLGNPADATAETDEPSRSSESLAGTVAVYDPAMCCSTGLCGPGVDPALLVIARDLRWIEKRGAIVQRFGLSQEPNVFVANTRIAGLMQAFGDGALPAVLVNDTVLCYGRYPTRSELVSALAREVSAKEPDASSCTPGSGCC